MALKILARRSMSRMSSRVDIALIVVILALTLYMEFRGRPRVQPASLNDPSLQKPMQPDIVSDGEVVMISFVIPPIVYNLLYSVFPAQPYSFTPLLFISGLLEANIVTIFLTNLFKLMVGRPRPYFVAACQSFLDKDSLQCSGDPLVVREARKSFPSGHSSLSFSAATFLTLSLLKPFSATAPAVKHKLFRSFSLMVPLFIATLIATSRLIDYHHHYSDVHVGSMLGVVTAYVISVTRAGVTPLMGVHVQGSGHGVEMETLPSGSGALTTCGVLSEDDNV